MSTTPRTRKFLALSIAVVAAAGIGLGTSSASFAADNSGSNTDPVVVNTSADTVTDGTAVPFTTTVTSPENATAAQVAADPSSTLASVTSTVDPMLAGYPNVDYAVTSDSRGGSITRNTVLARAQSWVDEGVPYSESSYYKDANGSYRMDCSGFVSMAWNLPTSRTTWTLDDSSLTTHISDSQLQPGDALDYDAEHIILFAGWVNQSAGTFHYYAESNPRVLTNEYTGNINSSSLAGWPTSDYQALRYNNITTDTVTTAAQTFYHAVRSASGSWTAFNSLGGADGAATFAGSQESIAAMPDGSSQVLGIGKDGNIYHEVRNANGTWTAFQTIPGPSGAAAFAATKVSIAGMPDGSSQVLAYGPGGNMYLDIRNANGTWTGWSELAGANGAATFAGPDLAIAAMPDGSSQLLAIGKDGYVYHEVRSATGTFSGFEPIAGVTTTDMAASSIGITGLPNGTSQIVAVGNDNNLYQTTRNTNGTWTGWTAPAGINGATKFAATQVGIAGMPDGTSQILATTH